MTYKEFIKLAKEGIKFEEILTIEKPKVKIKGVYKIVNNETNKIYIGSSIDIYSRWRSHIVFLQANKHHNIYLQRSYNKHGIEKFEFYLIENLTYKKHKGIKTIDFVRNKEQYYLDTLKPYKGNGYNISVNAWVPSHGSYGIYELENGISKFSLEEMLKIVEELEKGEKSLRKIEREYNISRWTLRSLRKGLYLTELTKGKNLDIRESKSEYLKREKREEIIKLYKDGMKKQQIANRYDTNIAIIDSVLAGFENKGVAKRVYQYDLKGDLLNVFESAAQASRETGVGAKSINSACKKYGSVYSGFRWSYTPYPDFTKEELVLGHRIVLGKGRAIIKYNMLGEIECCYENFHLITKYDKDIKEGRHLAEELNKKKTKIKYKNAYWKFLYQATKEEFDYLLNNKDKFISE